MRILHMRRPRFVVRLHRACVIRLAGDLIAAGVPEQFLPTFAEARGGQALI
jgi:hypothetical protein